MFFPSQCLYLHTKEAYLRSKRDLHTDREGPKAYALSRQIQARPALSLLMQILPAGPRGIEKHLTPRQQHWFNKTLNPLHVPSLFITDLRYIYITFET